jgi:hypothetical protein
MLRRNPVDASMNSGLQIAWKSHGPSPLAFMALTLKQTTGAHCLQATNQRLSRAVPRPTNIG